MLAKTQSTELSPAQKVEALESHMLEHEQVDCPVIHHFGPGIYVREVHLPKGTLALGHAQRFEHLNIMLRGKVAMPSPDGLKIIEAPAIYTGQPGRKFGYIIEDTVWQNVYATNETNIDKLEEMFLDKSDTWKERDSSLRQIREQLHEEDREDYRILLTQIGFTEEHVREQSENPDDQIPMPDGFAPKFTVRDSYIEGKGVFLSTSVEAGEVIAPARLGGKRTPAGRFTNHSKNANSTFILSENGDIYLVALKPISGCVGGEQGEEVTVNYRQALSLSDIQIEDQS